MSKGFVPDFVGFTSKNISFNKGAVSKLKNGSNANKIKIMQKGAYEPGAVMPGAVKSIITNANKPNPIKRATASDYYKMVNNPSYSKQFNKISTSTLVNAINKAEAKSKAIKSAKATEGKLTGQVGSAPKNPHINAGNIISGPNMQALNKEVKPLEKKISK